MTEPSRAAVGDRIPELRRRIELATLVRYAGASGDFNPIHFDDDHARQAGLPGVIGHGMLAMALVSEALTDWVGDSGLVRSLSVRFRHPFQPGDTLTAGGEVVGLGRDEGGRSRVELRLTCVTQDGIAVVGPATACVLTRPAGG